jgi:hypothetical protein
MGWVSASDYGRSQPDPLADSTAEIIQHMNPDQGSFRVVKNPDHDWETRSVLRAPTVPDGKDPNRRHSWAHRFGPHQSPEGQTY